MKILVGYDDSDCVRKALDEVIKIAKAFSGTVTVLNVFEPIYTETGGLEMLEWIETLKIINSNVKYNLRIEGSEEIAYTICKIDKIEGFNLIVIGKRD